MSFPGTHWKCALLKCIKYDFVFMFPETKFFVIVLVMFLFPEQDVEHLNSYHHWKILKNSSLAPWLNRYKRKKWSHDTGLREIQAVSELYHNKGAAAGAAFRLLRRFFALVGVAGCAWREQPWPSHQHPYEGHCQHGQCRLLKETSRFLDIN